GNRLCWAIARLSEQAVPVECWSIDELEGAGGRARDDPVHDFAGGRAAAPQNLRGTLPPLRRASQEIGNLTTKGTKTDSKRHKQVLFCASFRSLYVPFCGVFPNCC